MMATVEHACIYFTDKAATVVWVKRLFDLCDWTLNKQFIHAESWWLLEDDSSIFSAGAFKYNNYWTWTGKKVKDGLKIIQMDAIKEQKLILWVERGKPVQYFATGELVLLQVCSLLKEAN